jgi:hypothetical protein
MADVRSIIYQASVATSAAIQSAATALAANNVGGAVGTGRGAFMIQNLGTNALFVKLGAGATTSDFSVVLKGSTVNDDGTGGSFAMEMGTVYTGIVTVAGTSPRYVTVEI